MSSIERSFSFWRGGSALESTFRKPKRWTQGRATPPFVGKSILRCKSTIYSLNSSKATVIASTHHAPKQWSLSKTETVNNFENWKQNLVYTLSLDSHFAPFQADGVTWGKKTKASPYAALETMVQVYRKNNVLAPGKRLRFWRPCSDR